MGLFKDIGRAYDWACEVTAETVETVKTSTPDLMTLGKETFDSASSSGKAFAGAAMDVAADAASSLADALREPRARNTSGKGPTFVHQRNGENGPIKAGSSRDAGTLSDTSKTWAICVKKGCSNPQASDQFICWEHLYETQAYELAARRVREELQAREDQRLAALCAWKSCNGKRLEGEIYCSLHNREYEQLQARRCGRKFRYPLLEDARAEALRMQRLETQTFNVYMCNFCNHYHIGHGRPEQSGRF